MAFKLEKSPAKAALCFITVLLSVCSATVRAQTSGERHTYLFSSSISPLSSCVQFADKCSPTSTAFPQNDSNQNDTIGSNSRHQDDWVHAWMRRVAEARANQPHFVSPIVTTHVMLVQQYRYDMSRQQDAVGATVTSN